MEGRTLKPIFVVHIHLLHLDKVEKHSRLVALSSYVEDVHPI